jgi:nucleotide-binding universal stress UspA family protein
MLKIDENAVHFQKGSKKNKGRHILIALDDSKSAQRALLYVADFLGGCRGYRVTLLRVFPQPSEDFFETETERVLWTEDEFYNAKQMLEKYRSILIQAGFQEDKVVSRVSVRKCSSIAESILEEQKELGCCTVVVGRRTLSRKEEFLFGSTTNKLLHSEKRCALWIIE